MSHPEMRRDVEISTIAVAGVVILERRKQDPVKRLLSECNDGSFSQTFIVKLSYPLDHCHYEGSDQAILQDDSGVYEALWDT